MISTNTANPNPSSDPKVIFQNQDYTLRYSGPPLTEVERVVMTFPHRIHPPGTNVAGWGERFLRKRGAAVLSVLFEKVDWYQSPGFFPAMDAARAFLGDKIAITTYGSSMGAYGAILAAARIRADRVVAACPQFSIESDVAPFERRFRVEADEIGPFLHDVNGELRDDISYFVLHDPTHKIDHRHVALFSKPMNWENILFPGTGHNTLPAMTDAGMKDAVFALLMGQTDGRGVRQEIRERRGNSIYYIRRMGNLCSKFPQRVRGRAVFIDIARKRGLRKFVHKWTKADAAYQPSSKAPPIAAGRGPGELIIHVGLPNTEAIGIQTYFAREVDAIRSLGVDYPLGVSGRTPHHGWFGKSLLSGDFSELDRVLAQSPSPRMLLSDETIYNEAAFCEDATADALRERLAGRNLRVIACLRDGDSWMKSFYKQAMQNKGRGDATGSAAYWGSGLLFDAFFANPEIAMLARSSDMLARLERIFGVQVETIEMRRTRISCQSFWKRSACRRWRMV